MLKIDICFYSYNYYTIVRNNYDRISNYKKIFLVEINKKLNCSSPHGCFNLCVNHQHRVWYSVNWELYVAANLENLLRIVSSCYLDPYLDVKRTYSFAGVFLCLFTLTIAT